MFTLTLKTDNAAFCDEESHGAEEVARILAFVAKRVEDGHFEGPCKDFNGNTVGSYAFTTAKG